MSQSQYDMYEPVSTKKKKNQFNLFIEQIAVELNFGTHQVDSAGKADEKRLAELNRAIEVQESDSVRMAALEKKLKFYDKVNKLADAKTEPEDRCAVAVPRADQLQVQVDPLRLHRDELIDQVRNIRIERDDLADQTKHIRVECEGLQKQVALQESDFCDTLDESDRQVTDIDDKCQSYASHVSRLRTEVSQLCTQVPGLEADSHQDAASIRELQSSHSKQVRKFNNEIRNLRSQLKALQGRYWKLTSIKVKAVTRSVALNLKVKELDEWLDEILTSNEMLLAEAVLHVKAHEDLISKLNEAGETLGETTKKIVALRAS